MGAHRLDGAFRDYSVVGFMHGDVQCDTPGDLFAVGTAPARVLGALVADHTVNRHSPDFLTARGAAGRDAAGDPSRSCERCGVLGGMLPNVPHVLVKVGGDRPEPLRAVVAYRVV